MVETEMNQVPEPIADAMVEKLFADRNPNGWDSAQQTR